MPSEASSVDDLLTLPTVVDPDPYRHINLDALLEDLARKIYTVDEIITRYGLTKEGLRELLRRPAVFQLYDQKKQHWESDANAAERLKAYYQAGLIEAAPSLLQGLSDEKIPFKERVDAHRFVAKIAGLEPDPKVAANISGPSGPTFAVNIILSGQTHTISATMEPAAIPVEVSTDQHTAVEAAP